MNVQKQHNHPKSTQHTFIFTREFYIIESFCESWVTCFKTSISTREKMKSMAKSLLSSRKSLCCSSLLEKRKKKEKQQVCYDHTKVSFTFCFFTVFYRWNIVAWRNSFNNSYFLDLVLALGRYSCNSSSSPFCLLYQSNKVRRMEGRQYSAKELMELINWKNKTYIALMNVCIWQLTYQRKW